jgi:hypothetical protein
VAITANEALAADVAGSEACSAIEEAIEWLQQLLAGGAMPATLVQAEAEAAGLSWATVRRAKKVAGIETYREGGKGKAGHWFWRLPPKEPLRCSSNPYDAQERNVSTLSKFEHLSVGFRRPSTGSVPQVRTSIRFRSFQVEIVTRIDSPRRFFHHSATVIG